MSGLQRCICEEAQPGSNSVKQSQGLWERGDFDLSLAFLLGCRLSFPPRAYFAIKIKMFSRVHTSSIFADSEEKVSF